MDYRLLLTSPACSHMTYPKITSLTRSWLPSPSEDGIWKVPDSSNRLECYWQNWKLSGYDLDMPWAFSNLSNGLALSLFFQVQVNRRIQAFAYPPLHVFAKGDARCPWFITAIRGAKYRGMPGTALEKLVYTPQKATRVSLLPWWSTQCSHGKHTGSEMVSKLPCHH